uniref:Integrin beta n=1 Tax=Pundamilia nyererei TaxID=303518 RepID=A0A3B4EUV9_9CICH
VHSHDGILEPLASFCSLADHSHHKCESQGVRSCGECLAAGPHCHIWERCDTAGALLKRGCPFDHLEDPRGSTVLLKNRKITFHPKEQRHKRLHRVVTQLQPQTVLLHLRPGEPQSFEVKFKQVKDYLIDLYYLMDLSFSMEDDLMNVKKLGADLMKEMKNITSDFRLCLFASDMLRNPWGQRISSNLDSPEVGLNDLMQATMCERQIGWRNVTRLLVFSTDAVFHVAGDGKLSCIVLPNDGKCHLLQLFTFFRRTIIFFFTKEKKFKLKWCFHYRSIIVGLALKWRLTALLAIVSTGLAHLLYSHCKDHRPRHGEQGRRCSNISVDDEVSFNVSITAPLCVAASQRPCRFIIKPQGYSEEVEVLLSPICECSCQKDRVPHSPSCSHGNRTLECGACRCKAGRAGTFSECEQEESGTAVDSHLCRRDNASEVCSGHRKCICGRCVCQKSSKKPSHVYYGELCECSDFSCDQYRGLQCGRRGRCVWGECLCFPAFRGRAYECLSQDGQICGGSHCGTCICHDKRFQGPTCELCPSCPSICNLHHYYDL